LGFIPSAPLKYAEPFKTIYLHTTPQILVKVRIIAVWNTKGINCLNAYNDNWLREPQGKVGRRSIPKHLPLWLSAMEKIQAYMRKICIDLHQTSRPPKYNAYPGPTQYSDKATQHRSYKPDP